VVTGVADAEWPEAFGAAMGLAISAWSADDALDGEIVVPFGTFPAPMVALIYVEEQVTHGWDLAMAIGQQDSLDPALAEVILPVVQQYVPADGRGGAMGFGLVGRGTRFGTRVRPVGGVPGPPTGHRVTTVTGR